MISSCRTYRAQPLRKTGQSGISGRKIAAKDECDFSDGEVGTSDQSKNGSSAGATSRSRRCPTWTDQANAGEPNAGACRDRGYQNTSDALASERKACSGWRRICRKSIKGASRALRQCASSRHGIDGAPAVCLAGIRSGRRRGCSGSPFHSRDCSALEFAVCESCIDRNLATITGKLVSKIQLRCPLSDVTGRREFAA